MVTPSPYLYGGGGGIYMVQAKYKVGERVLFDDGSFTGQPESWLEGEITSVDWGFDHWEYSINGQPGFWEYYIISRTPSC